MFDRRKISVGAVCAFLLALGSWGASSNVATAQAQPPKHAPCVDYLDDPAGCQPGPFQSPMAKMPSARVNREGKVDSTSSEADARAGFAMLEKQLHLYRNFEPLHWVLLVPSKKDPATGKWSGGDIDGTGDGRSFAISGNCIYVGHRSETSDIHQMDVLKIQSDPVKQAPVVVGSIPTPVGVRRLARGPGLDDKEARTLIYKTSSGQDKQILIRLAEGLIETYNIDTNTCLPTAKVSAVNYPGAPHEFFLWHDPANPNRLLMFVTMVAAGVPDPDNPGKTIQDADVFAVTDEKTGDLLPSLRLVAGFSLPDVGGPPANEKPDATGLFSDGRYADYSQLKSLSGTPGAHLRVEGNHLHSLSVSDDGERVYVAGGSAGFYILNSEAIAHNTDNALSSGTAGCNLRSTVVASGGSFDASKIGQIDNDCLHMVVDDDPGLKALLASDASPQVKEERYLVMITRARFDVHPPFNSETATHSAVIVPGRPAEVNGNTKNRPAYAIMTDENFGCPTAYGRVLSIEVESVPIMVGGFAVPDDNLDSCLAESTVVEPNGQPRPRRFEHLEQQVHNPTVFKDLVFVGWYSHGLRVFDISLPFMPREVGYIIPLPLGGARGYPIFKDGLMYWIDTRNGLHVARYTGPWSEEVSGLGAGLVYDGNSTSPHR
jgi:hypothetical protein